MTTKLYVGNISWNTTEEGLAEYFNQCGTVVEAKIITDRETGRSRGFGFVTMSTGEEAQAAQDKLDGQNLDGRELRVNEAREREDSRGGRGGGGGGRGYDNGRRGGGRGGGGGRRDY
jgi:RNA recognition motif-containing protein